MAKEVEVELNLKGLRELFRSEGMQSFVDRAGSDIARKASGMSGEDYTHRTHLADNTAICNVYPNSKEAAKDNYENNTLLKAKAGYPSTKPHL